ncbi:MAG: carbohydrate binding family 9 domain-containing protein, partial [Longimicrobiales bacterium]|nr:carbohydrate binding family 9 domain-containing protein [Longimicrobiales bacterium]
MHRDRPAFRADVPAPRPTDRFVRSSRSSSPFARSALLISALALGLIGLEGMRLSAQVSDTTTVEGTPSGQEGSGQGFGAGDTEILGPPAPLPPETVSRTEEGEVTLRASRVTGGIEVDGQLDEPFYQQTEPVSNFIQTVPVAGDEPSERTEAWVGFDEENFYVAARIWDSQGEDGWIANEMRRDSPELRQNDNFGVFIDTYYDRRNAMGFYVNPIGGFSDFQITNEGNPNFDWNPVYEVQTGRFDGGWVVEYAIPFESLRYRPGREQVWGIQLRRSVLRRNEWNHLTYLPLSVAPNGSTGVFRVSMYGTLVGVEAPPPSQNLEIKPYGISGLRTDLTASPTFENDGYADAGLDVKYGITQNLTAD